MTQEPVADEALELAIVACSTCDTLFLDSPRRHSCPGCGGNPGLVFFEFIANSHGIQLKSSGLELASEVVQDAPAGERPPPHPPAEAPPFETETDTHEFESARDDVFVDIGRYLMGYGHTGERIRAKLESLNYDPEGITVALGRLEAVRDFLHSRP